MHAADRAVVALARRQHAMVTTRQLVAAGLGRSAVASRVARGWLMPRHRGVYQVGPVCPPHGGDMAAVLACGPRALLSHYSAAALWGIRASHEGPVHITVHGRPPRTRRGIEVHGTARAHALDAAVLHGLPLTNPARTVRDLAPLLSQHELDRVTEQAQVLNLATKVAIEGLLDGGRGTAALRRALYDEPSLTRSEAERLLRRLIREARLPRPDTNIRIHGHEVDFVWRSRRVIVEVDGFAYHGSRAAFERDRARDADLAAAGYRVVRITWRQLTNEPHAVVARLAVLLAP